MATSTFAALFLAHVIADYLLQTGWMVANKRRALSIGLHIGAVFVMMPVVTLALSPWFLALAAMHLAIDLTKTHILRGSLAAYVADQLLHLASIGLVVALAPDLWAETPLAPVESLPRFYLILAVLIFAARGGQYAVATLFGIDPEADSRGVRVGWLERSALVACVATGAPWAMLGVLAAKSGHAAAAWSTRDARGRTRLIRGGIASLSWGLACAAGLWAVLPSIG